MRLRLPSWQCILTTLIMVASTQTAAVASQPDAKIGKHISTTCAACHGSDGLSVDTSIPNIAGQHYVYLVQQLNAFKQGGRNSPLMNELARSLSEEQIEDISAYYASVPIEVGKSPKPKR